MRLHFPNVSWSLTETILHPNYQRRHGARGNLLPMQTAAIKTCPYPLFVDDSNPVVTTQNQNFIHSFYWAPQTDYKNKVVIPVLHWFYLYYSQLNCPSRTRIYKCVIKMRHLAVALNASMSGIYCALLVTVNLLCTSAAAGKITSDSNDTKHSQELCKGTRLNKSRLLQSFTIFTEPDQAEETHFMALLSISNQSSFLQAEHQEVVQINMPIMTYFFMELFMNWKLCKCLHALWVGAQLFCLPEIILDAPGKQ